MSIINPENIGKDMGTAYKLSDEEENELIGQGELTLKYRQTTNFKVGDKMNLLGNKNTYLAQVKNIQPYYQPFGIDINVILIEILKR